MGKRVTGSQILMTSLGCYWLMQQADTVDLLPELREHLRDKCAVETRPYTEVEGNHEWRVESDYEWVVFVLPAKHHPVARAFLIGWAKGRRCGRRVERARWS